MVLRGRDQCQARPYLVKVHHLSFVVLELPLSGATALLLERLDKLEGSISVATHSEVLPPVVNLLCRLVTQDPLDQRRLGDVSNSCKVISLLITIEILCCFNHLAPAILISGLHAMLYCKFAACQPKLWPKLIINYKSKRPRF